MGIRLECERCGEMYSPREEHVCKPVRNRGKDNIAGIGAALAAIDDKSAKRGADPMGDGDELQPAPDTKKTTRDAGDVRKRKARSKSKRSERGRSSNGGNSGRPGNRAATKAPATPSRGRPKKGQEAKTLTAKKPWEKEGISRASWYRKKGSK